MKTCTKCGNTKETTAFPAASEKRRSSWCRACHNAAARSRYHRVYAQASSVLPSLETPRTCTRCKNVKTCADFGRVKNSPDGLRRECKACRVAREQDRYMANVNVKRQYGRDWNAANRDRLRAGKAARKKAIKQATPSWLTAIQRAQIAEQYDIALARTIQTGVPHEVDHIYPINGTNSRGLHVPWNLQVLTAADNNAKRRRLPSNVTNKAN